MMVAKRASLRNTEARSGLAIMNNHERTHKERVEAIVQKQKQKQKIS